MDGVGGLGLEAHQRLGRTGDNGQEGQVSQVGRSFFGAARALPGTFVFKATLADGTSRTFAARAGGQDKPLVRGPTPSAPGGGVRRVSITPLHDTRLLVLLEAEDPELHTFSRLGEVGYTREGVAFAAGDSYPLCIVTEGRGTIQVKYKGKSYWVCCTGCREMFKEDPESVLAEAAAREKAKAKK